MLFEIKKKNDFEKIKNKREKDFKKIKDDLSNRLFLHILSCISYLLIK